jgi:hypothetical protein
MLAARQPVPTGVERQIAAGASGKLTGPAIEIGGSGHALIRYRVQMGERHVKR